MIVYDRNLIKRVHNVKEFRLNFYPCSEVMNVKCILLEPDLSFADTRTVLLLTRLGAHTLGRSFQDSGIPFFPCRKVTNVFHTWFRVNLHDFDFNLELYVRYNMYVLNYINISDIFILYTYNSY